jgi:DNA polymerase epsilon subunit 3
MPPKGVKIAPPAVAPDVDSPAAQQEQTHLAGMAEFELPRTTLTKLAKGSVGVVRAGLTIDSR